MKEYPNTYIEVKYVDTDKYDQPFTKSKVFHSLSKARKFAQKVSDNTPYDLVEIVQVTETVLEKFEPKY